MSTTARFPFRSSRLVAIVTSLALLAGLSIVTAAPSVAAAVDTRTVSGIARNGEASAPVLSNTPITLSLDREVHKERGGSYHYPLYSYPGTTSDTGAFSFADVRLTDGLSDGDGIDFYTYGYYLTVERSPDGSVQHYTGKIDPSGAVIFVVPLGTTLTGKVTAAASPNVPIAGATVSDTTRPLTATTDSGGNFVIRGLSAEIYKFYIAADGYNNSGTQRVVFTAGQATANLGFSMTKLSVVSGNVTSTEGSNALAGINVSAGGLTTTTNAAGFYTFPPQKSRVSLVVAFVDPTGKYMPYSTSVRPAGDTNARVDATLVQAAAISGTVKANGANPQPLAGAKVELLNQAGTAAVTTAVADTQGNYAFTNVTPGTYTVRFSAGDTYFPQWWSGASAAASAKPVVIASGQTVGRVDALLDTLQTLGNVSGKVSFGGTPAAGASTEVRVDLTRTDGAAAYALTDSNGNYTLSGIPSGQYTVKFTPTNTAFAAVWWKQASTEASSTLLSVAPSASLTGINATLPAKEQFVTPATPVVTGNAIVGSKLTTAPGAWGPASVVLTYTWKRDSVIIPGASGKTYVVAKADVGKRLAVSVVGHADGYTTKSATSVASLKVVKPFSSVGKATISGTFVVGKTVTAKVGTWSPTPAKFYYQWRRNGSAIAGATASKYVLKAADAGARISVKVTAGATGYATSSATSPESAAVLRTFSSAPTPKITGAAIVGRTAKAVAGTWAPAPTTFKYQWKRNGVAIAGATSSLYTLVSKDRGTYITVTVSGTKTGYLTVAKSSASLRP